MSNFPITLSSFLAIRDVEDYIEEWLNFYLLQGVQKFIIYDYSSKDNTPNLIKPYMDRGIVEYSYFTERYLEPYKHLDRWFEALSLKHRLDVIEEYREAHKWMCFFDLDEFTFPTNSPDDLWLSKSGVLEELNLREWLEAFDKKYKGNVSALAINWTIFGDSGEKVKKDDYVISRFNRRAPLDYNEHDHCKVICKPSKVDLQKSRCEPNPHYFYYFEENKAVNEKGYPAGTPKVINGEYYDFHRAFSAYPETCSSIRCNHYMIKSREEYAQKSLRHEDLNNKNYAEPDENLKIYNSEQDDYIKKYIPLLNSINLDNYSL